MISIYLPVGASPCLQAGSLQAYTGSSKQPDHVIHTTYKPYIGVACPCAIHKVDGTVML